MSNTTDVELAAITCDTSLSIEIKYDDKLNEEEGVNIQCAILYTSFSGQRRLRVHNLALNTCGQMAELFRSCELDTMMNIFLKDGLYSIFMFAMNFHSILCSYIVIIFFFSVVLTTFHIQ